MSIGMNLGSDTLADLVRRDEPLHPDLVRYVIDGPLGPFLNHPLVQDIGPVDVARGALQNKRYAAKQEALAEARADEDWHKYIHLHERPYRINAFEDIEHELKGRHYWRLLAETWIDTENDWQCEDQWRELWNDDRPGKPAAMEANERKAFRTLPEELTIYRGVAPPHSDDGLSWTTDKAKAEWFAQRYTSPREREGRAVLTARAKKADAHAYLLRRGESEIVIERFEIVKREHI